MIIVIVTIQLTLSSIIGQYSTHDPKMNKGVKRMTQYSYKIEEKFGEKTEVLSSKWTYEYDSSGLLTEIVSQGSGKYFESYIQRNQYYSNDKLKKSSMFDIEGNLHQGSWSGCYYQYKYNSNGDLVDETSFTCDGSKISVIQYKYDSRGNQIERNDFHSDGSLSRKFLYKYDSSGNQIEMSVYDSGGSLSTKHIFKFDSRGRKIEKSWYNSEGLRYGKIEYIFNSNGNLSEELTYSREGSLISKDVTFYDTENRPKEELSYNIQSKFGTEQEILTYKNKFVYLYY